MDKLIEDLLLIEATAKDDLANFEDERSAFSQSISAEISRHTLDVKRECDKKIQTLKQEAEDAVLARLAEIENEYQQNVAQLKELFDTNREKWRKEWAARVLT